MKRILSLAFALLMLCAAALAEPAIVTLPEELLPALESADTDSVEITADMTVTDSYVYLTKDTVILADLVYQPAPDDGFFVKSIEIPEGVTLTVRGCFTTRPTFEGGFCLAQIYLSGGTLDLSEGSVSPDINICFNAGTLIPPADGFGPDSTVARYLSQDVTEESIAAALEVEGLRNVTVQEDVTITGNVVIPEGKSLTVYNCCLTVAGGASLSGEVLYDGGTVEVQEGGILNLN